MAIASPTAAISPAIAPEDAGRAQAYRLLAHFLSAPPTRDSLAIAARLQGDASELGQAIGMLARLAREESPDKLVDEYQVLLVGLGRGELIPYGSYYLTGFLQEKPLARLRAEMARLGIVRDGAVKEPEDHIASVLEAMAGLIDGAFGSALDLTGQRRFFDAHIGSWAGHFLADLERSRTSAFYGAVGSVGRVLIAIETEAFRMLGPAVAGDRGEAAAPP